MHLRITAEEILNSDQVLSRDIDPWSRPIAGLKLITPEGNHTKSFTPMEILPDAVRPIIIFDLDDTVWEHIRHVVSAVSDATNIPITWEEFKQFGHTRKIPVWNDSPGAMAIHDQIQRGEHPDFFPFVNRAWPKAVETLEAVRLMGHDFSFLTARSPKLFDATLRVMKWNAIVHDHEQDPVDARSDEIPRKGILYCAYSELSDVHRYKFDVVKQWVSNVQGAGRNGPIVIIDDLLRPFQTLVESGEVVGISLAGPLNQHMPPYPNERRVASWQEIGEILMDIHRKALAADPSPFRLFDCRPMMEDTVLVVSKAEAGNGEFTLENIRHGGFVSAKRWHNEQSVVLRELGIT